MNRAFFVASVIAAAARPLAAQTVVTGGAPNGNAGWNIFDDNRAATSFSISSSATFDAIRFWGILFQNAPYAPNIFWQILSDVNGAPSTTVVAEGNAVAASTLRTQVSPIAYSWQFDFSTMSNTLGSGLYWLALHDGPVDPSGVDAAGYTGSSLLWETSATAGAYDIQTFSIDENWNSGGDQSLAFELRNNDSVTATPEPGTLGLIALGLLSISGLGFRGRRRNRRVTAAAIGAAMFALPSARAQAQAPKIYSACYVPLTGTVYRIKESDLKPACTSPSHVEFSWTDGANAVRFTDPLMGDVNGFYTSNVVTRLFGRPLSPNQPVPGEVLTFDSNAWAPATPPTGGVTNHGALTGLTADDHPQYLLNNGLRTSLNGFAVGGTLGAGSIPATGEGSRVMWYPRKAAVRAGILEPGFGNEWSDQKIGEASVALGANTTASGHGSLAAGYAAGANGDYSISLGFATAANGRHSAALGFNALALADQSTAVGSAALADRFGAFVYSDGSSSNFVTPAADNQFVVRSQKLWFGTNNTVTATAGRFLETSTGGFLSSGGTWTNSSDVNRKHLFEDISGDSVLARLAAMPIRTWTYNAESDSVRHIGPTAQDFRAAFRLGDSETSIATVDADGVSLAAIQALEKRARKLAQENAELRARLERLEAVISKLQRQP